MRSSCALATLLLKLDSPSSLKEKRSIIRSAVERLGARKNVAVAETGQRDTYKAAELTIAVVGDSPSYVEEELRRMISSIESDDAIEVFVTRLEVY